MEVTDRQQQQQPAQSQPQQKPQQPTNPQEPEKVSVACQTEPNLIDKLIDNHVRKQLDEIDLYQEYVRSAQCAQFWPLDKNPIRSLVPAMVKVDLPEQYLKNESLMFDLVQAITNNSKLVNLLAKYIHHIVPNVIISKRIDLIPLITCTIRVCRDTNEQERLISLLFNLIKRPNEEQRRMILSGIIVVLQVSPHQSSSLLLPNLWDHVNDKFPERRILLAESCATLAHYVRPAMRTNLVLSILIQLLKDKNAAVRAAACKSFACLLTLIMDRNDEVFDACLSATEDIIQDVLQQTPVNFCEHRFELEQMSYCALETVYPLLCMWAVKLNRFKIELAEFYLSKAETYITNMLTSQQAFVSHRAICAYMKMLNYLVPFVFSDAVHSCAWLSKSSLHLAPVVSATSCTTGTTRLNSEPPSEDEKAVDNNNNNTSGSSGEDSSSSYPAHQNGFSGFTATSRPEIFVHLFDRPLKFSNKLLDPTLIIEESAIVAFHDQLEQEHMIESLDWILNKFLPKFLVMMSHFSHKKFYSAIEGGTPDALQDFLFTSVSSTRQLCLLFGKHLTRTKIRPLIKEHIISHRMHSLYFIYIASLTAFEPIEQQEFEDIVSSIRQNLSIVELTRNDVEILAISIKIIATNTEQIHSPSTRQKFLTYILDALVNYSNQIIRTTSLSTSSTSMQQNQSQKTKLAIQVKNKCTGAGNKNKQDQHQQTQTKEFMLIVFRHILTCLIDQSVRPLDWAQILVTKFLPLLISLANDATDVYVCTYARLMCAQLVETFDTYLNCPKLNKQTAGAILPALVSLKNLTEQIRASNLKRQIECLTHDLNEKFFKDENNNNKYSID